MASQYTASGEKFMRLGARVFRLTTDLIDHENGCQWLASHAVVLLARQAILPDVENETNPFKKVHIES